MTRISFLVLCCVGCSTGGTPPGPCEDMGPVCGTGCCAVGDECTDEGCCASANVCGARCCGAGEACTAAGCCPSARVCANACCGVGYVCGETGSCIPEWAADSGCGGCGAGEVCYRGACIEPGAECDGQQASFCFEECPDEEYCDPAVGRCLPRDPAVASCSACSGDAGCVFDVEPEWVGANLSSTPAVGDLDGDGIPEVVYVTGATSSAALVALHGNDGSRYFSTPVDTPVDIDQYSVAIGNLDDDPLPEIVTCSVRLIDCPSLDCNGLVAFENDGTPKWGPVGQCNYTTAPAIADLDRDGAPEVLLGYRVFNGEDGTLQTLLRDDTETLWPPAGPLVWGHPGEWPIAADVSGDGYLDVILGNAAWSGADGTLLFENTDVRAGAGAVADLDLDGDPEIVNVFFGDYQPWPNNPVPEVTALHHDGTILWGPVRPEVCSSRRYTFVGASPAAIADIDDDERPEVFLTCEAGVVALNGRDGSVIWSRWDHIGLGGGTPTVFDFEGDGCSELVYRSQGYVRIVRARDGVLVATLPGDTNFGATIVADVDADGHAELITGAAVVEQIPGHFEIAVSGAGESRLAVLSDRRNSWTGARPIWNQHSYHVTNIDDDLGVPINETPHWTVPDRNNFRYNSALASTRRRNSPDLVLTEMAADGSQCSEGAMVLWARVHNQGALGVPAEQMIHFYRAGASGPELLGTALTRRSILPGESEGVRFEWRGAPEVLEMGSSVWAEVDPAGVGAGVIRECNETNNESTPIEVRCGLI